MAGYQTIEALRPILHRGPPPMPVVDRALVRPRKRGRGAKLTHDDIAKISARRLALESLHKIAKDYSVSHTTIMRVTAHLVPPPGGWPKGRDKCRERQAFAERLLRAGFSLAEASEETGMSKTVLSHIRSGRKSSPWRQSPLSRIVRAVRDATGVSGNAIRRWSFNAHKASDDVSRARHIVFWIATRRAGLEKTYVARELGGFDASTIHRGRKLADAVAANLDMPEGMPNGRMARLMWEAKWPRGVRRPC